jgi:uncharacterized membrane protein YqgA involved in biofilm formation
MWLMCLNFAACTSWKLVHRSELPSLETRQAAIRILLTDGSSYESSNYSFTADSLVFVTGKTAFYSGTQKSISMDELLAIEKQVLDPSESLIAITSIGIFFYLISQLQSAFSWPIN